MAGDIHYKHETGTTDLNGNVIFYTTIFSNIEKITVSKDGFETIEINFNE